MVDSLMREIHSLPRYEERIPRFEGVTKRRVRNRVAAVPIANPSRPKPRIVRGHKPTPPARSRRRSRRPGQATNNASRGERSIRVMVVATTPLMQYGVSRLLSEDTSIQVVADIAETRQALDMVGHLHPDVIILYQEGTDHDGRRVIASFRAAAPDSKVLLLTDAEDEGSVLAALKAGVSGYGLRQSVWPEDIRSATRTVARGCVWICPSTTSRLVAAAVQRIGDAGSPGKCSNGPLTEREIEILTLVSDGARNNDIAEALFLSKNTVKTYLRRILEKLGANNRQQAVARAISVGLLPERRYGKRTSLPDTVVPMKT